MATDYFPVGAVLSFGGVLNEPKNWLLCDGSELNNDDYPELFNVIGNIYGGNKDNKKFKVPDYRGMFLRGATHNTKTDPDGNSRISLSTGGTVDVTGPGSLQDSATKLPGTPFKANFAHLPTSTKDSHGITRTGNTGPSGSETRNTCTRGGDNETRPKNVYVNYYIKARG